METTSSQGSLGQLARFFRPADWWPQIGLVLLGYMFVGPVGPILPLLMSLLAGTLFLATGYGLNNIADVSVDEPEKNPLAGKGLHPRAAILACALLACLGVALGLILSLATAAVFMCGILADLVYSFPPFRLKRYLLSNLAINSLGFTALALISTLARNAAAIEILLFGGFVFLALLPYQLVHLYSHRHLDPLSNLPRNPLGLFFAMHLALLLWSGLMAYRLGWPLFLGAAVAHLLSHSALLSRRKKKPWESLRREMRVVSAIWGFTLLALFTLRWV